MTHPIGVVRLRNDLAIGRKPGLQAQRTELALLQVAIGAHRLPPTRGVVVDGPAQTALVVEALGLQPSRVVERERQPLPHRDEAGPGRDGALDGVAQPVDLGALGTAKLGVGDVREALSRFLVCDDPTELAALAGEIGRSGAREAWPFLEVLAPVAGAAPEMIEAAARIFEVNSRSSRIARITA